MYDESVNEMSMMVTVTDAEGQRLFADTIELDRGTDRFSGIELPIEVLSDQSYTVEADIPGVEGVSTETVVDCGNVYIGVTESGDVEIRADSHEGD